MFNDAIFKACTQTVTNLDLVFWEEDKVIWSFWNDSGYTTPCHTSCFKAVITQYSVLNTIVAIAATLSKQNTRQLR